MLRVSKAQRNPVLIGSWNVNSVRTRLDHVLAWLQSHQPDLLCLQETKVEIRCSRKQPSKALAIASAFTARSLTTVWR